MPSHRTEDIFDQAIAHLGNLSELGYSGLPRIKSAAPNLESIRTELGDCTRCKLHRQGRKQIVFGVGNPQARLMFIGEAPGADEDAQGEPFVGRAGQLLTRMIQAMGLQRQDVYITNTVKCRPPNNRNPEPDELSSCEPFWKMQIAAVAPEVIVTLGNIATQTVLNTPEGISRLRGRFQKFGDVTVMPTYHPAFLLRSPNMKKEVWEDLKKVMARLGLKTP